MSLITDAMQVSVLAGSGSATWGDGQGLQAHFFNPIGVAVDGDSAIVADQGHHRIRKISPDGTVSTLAGTGHTSWGDGQGAQAHFHSPAGVAVDVDGNVIVADQGNHRIRKISPDGTVSTLVGSGNASWGDGQGSQAHFWSPSGVAVDLDGNVIVADQGNHRIRKISPDGTVSTLAGSGNASWGDSQGTQAHFRGPQGVAVDVDGSVVVADTQNHRIRKISPSGTVSTLAGSGNASWGDGQGIQAHFRNPSGVAVDGDGNVIVADQQNHRIRKISPDGTVSTLAGSGNPTWGDGQGMQAHFSTPSGVAVDGNGNVIVADLSNHRIRKIAASLAPPDTPSAALPQLPSVFVAQMEALLNDEAMSDVTFVVSDARIQAHRVILVTRSQYFRTMLTSGFSEGQAAAKEITIGDTTPDAFKSILRYLYTDELHFDDEHLIDVMRKAKEISLERVYNHTVQRCRRDISVHNVVHWLVKSDEYGLEDLRSATFGFLARNFRQVKAQARRSLQILSDKPHLMMEVMLEAI